MQSAALHKQRDPMNCVPLPGAVNVSNLPGGSPTSLHTWAAPLMGLSWLFDSHEISFKGLVTVFLLLVCSHAMNTERLCSA